MASCQRGSILLLVLMFLVVLTVLVTVFMNTIIHNNTNVTIEYSRARAFYLAEAGLNKAIYYLKNTAPDGTTCGAWRTSAYPTAAGNVAPAACTASSPCEESLGDGTYTIWAERYDNNTKVKITSTGLYGGVTRTVQQQIYARKLEGLLNCWSFNGTLNDSIGDANGSMTSGSPSYTTDRNNNASSTINLGGSAHVDLGTSSSTFNYSSSGFSYSIWMKGNSNGYLNFFYSTSGTPQFQIYHWASSAVGAATNNVSCGWGAAAVTISDDNWHHVAFTYAPGGSLIGYVDAVEACSQSGVPAGGLDTRGGEHSIGKGYTGVLDDARVYDSALSPAEVSALYAENDDVVPNTWKECNDTCS